MFDDFWAAYPARDRRKLGRALSKAAFEQLSDEEQRLCVSAAKNYARACKPNSGEFTPRPRDPIRFLRQDWWRDWLDGALVVCCDFRCTPPCEQPVRDGQTACEFHTAYRAKLAARKPM